METGCQLHSPRIPKIDGFLREYQKAAIREIFGEPKRIVLSCRPEILLK
jgi:hypothetical protein